MGLTRRTLGVATFVVGGAAAACSALLTGSAVQCGETADCVAKGGKFLSSVCVGGICELPAGASGALAGTTFSCLDEDAGDAAILSAYEMKVVFYDLTKTRSGAVTASIGGFSYAPIPGMSVKTCFPLDTGCKKPTTTQTTDAAGTVTISVQPGTTNFIDAEDPAYLPTLFFPPAYARPTDQAFLVGLLSPSDFAGAAQSAGVDLSKSVGPDASLGNINAASFDCDRNLAANVAWSIDDPDGSTRAYVVGGLISTAATVTSNEGTALFYNAPVRSTQVTALYGDSGVTLQSQNVVVRAGAQTVVFTWP